MLAIQGGGEGLRGPLLMLNNALDTKEEDVRGGMEGGIPLPE